MNENNENNAVVQDNPDNVVAEIEDNLVNRLNENNADNLVHTAENQTIEVMPLQIDTALRMIPEFHGNRDELHKFITCCDIVAGTCSLRGDAESLVNVIKTKLCGSAYNLVKYKTFADWAALKIILQAQYLEHRTIAQLQTKLVNSRQ